MVRSNSIQPDPTKKKQPWQGALSKRKVGGSEGSPLQEVDYAYNIRGWLTSVNQPQNLGKDLFGFELKYQNPVSNGKDTPKYNGNISQMDWKTRSNNEELRRYTYQYDDLNRLTKSFYSKPLAVQPNTGSYDEYLSYDVNGNIKTLSRFGDMDKPQAVKIDELSYTYIGNQLVKVSDNSQNPSGYPIGGGVIPYDENGNMMNHNDKGISYIGYNHLNLPSAVFWNGKQTFYLYRADGVKVKKDFPGKVTDYLDRFQYENGALQFVPTAEGYYDFVKQRYVYNYTDHLGNVRLSYAKNNNGALEILEENNYYAFGLRHQGYGGVNLGNPNYHYKYNGKELQENSMYDYGARLYMPDIGRWNTIDPLAEKYPNISPYTYVANNPINAIDPDGRDIIFISKTGQQLVYSKGHFYYASIYKDKDGNYITRNTGKKYDGRTDNVSVTLFRLARVYRDIEHSKNNILKTQLHTLENSDNLHIIREGSDNSVTRSFSLEKNGHLINIGRKETDSNHTLTTFNFSKEDKKTKEKMNKIYTFIAEYRGGTYISQCKSDSLELAIKIWAEDKTKIFLDEIRYKKLLDTYEEENPVRIKDVDNVWCCAYVLNRSFLLLNIISN